LQKLAKVLQERPAVHMKICGVAVPADRQALLEKATADMEKAILEARETQPPETDEGQGEKITAESDKAIPEARETQPAKTDGGQGQLIAAEEEPAPPAAKVPAPQVTDQQLKALATQRGTVVKRALREQHGIKAGRFYLLQNKAGLDDPNGNRGRPRCCLRIDGGRSPTRCSH